MHNHRPLVRITYPDHPVIFLNFPSIIRTLLASLLDRYLPNLYIRLMGVSMNPVSQEVARKWGYMPEVRSFRVVSSVDRFESAWSNYFRNFIPIKADEVRSTKQRQLLTRCTIFGAHAIAFQYRRADLSKRYALMNLRNGLFHENQLHFLAKITQQITDIQAIIVPFERAEPIRTIGLARLLEDLGIECAITDQMDETVRYFGFDPISNRFLGCRMIRNHGWEQQILATHGF